MMIGSGVSRFREQLGNTISEKCLDLHHPGLNSILITASDQKYAIGGRIRLLVVTRLISTFRCQVREHSLDKGNIFDALLSQLFVHSLEANWSF